MIKSAQKKTFRDEYTALQPIAHLLPYSYDNREVPSIAVVFFFSGKLDCFGHCHAKESDTPISGLPFSHKFHELDNKHKNNRPNATINIMFEDGESN